MRKQVCGFCLGQTGFSVENFLLNGNDVEELFVSAHIANKHMIQPAHWPISMPHSLIFRFQTTQNVPGSHDVTILENFNSTLLFSPSLLWSKWLTCKNKIALLSDFSYGLTQSSGKRPVGKRVRKWVCFLLTHPCGVAPGWLHLSFESWLCIWNSNWTQLFPSGFQ